MIYANLCLDDPKGRGGFVSARIELSLVYRTRFPLGTSFRGRTWRTSPLGILDNTVESIRNRCASHIARVLLDPTGENAPQPPAVQRLRFSKLGEGRKKPGSKLIIYIKTAADP